MAETLIGAYGEWAAQLHLSRPGRLSLRRGAVRDLRAWRRRARARVWDCLAPPPLPRLPRVRLDARGEWDGVRWERLSWQLPWGGRTEAIYLRPASAAPDARLPAILALHDHGGQKFFGWEKIARIDAGRHPVLREHDGHYGGRSWANEAAKRGYAVLVHDTLAFGSRRVRIADVPESVRGQAVDPVGEGTAAEIAAYNDWAGWHETLMAKSLYSAGTSWTGTYVVEDQVALSVLAARKDVDAARIACGGLSGGGLRTAYLAGLDDRIRCCFCVGFMTTWRDLVLNRCHTHTWMVYAPGLPRELDFPEILALRAPLPTLVQNTNQDALFTLSEMKRAAATMRDAYRRAGAPAAIRTTFRDGPHHFDIAMQEEAFAWVDRWLAHRAPRRIARSTTAKGK